jgi:hypothetical protein
LSAEHPQEDKSRLGGYSRIYCEFSEKEFSNSVEIEERWKKEGDILVRSELQDLHFKAGVKTILFAALGVEAAINDYAAWQLGDNYFDTHLSSLDVLSKWVVIPKLVCGKSIDKSGPAYSALKQLITARNDLVHNKSRHLDLSAPNLTEKLEKRSKGFDANIYSAYRAVVLLSLTMEKLLGHRYNPLKSFDRKVNLMLDIPENIIGVVNECRNIVARNHS